jgi:hypothetical protein
MNSRQTAVILYNVGLVISGIWAAENMLEKTQARFPVLLPTEQKVPKRPYFSRSVHGYEEVESTIATIANQCIFRFGSKTTTKERKVCSPNRFQSFVNGHTELDRNNL